MRVVYSLHLYRLYLLTGCRSISIACWVVVFSPQIIENFRRGSADGLSLLFLVIWLAGDVFNIIGAVLQGVLPTMIILAVYYTLADIVLLCQCFYYRGFTLQDEVSTPETQADDEEGPGSPVPGKVTERSALLPKPSGHTPRPSVEDVDGEPGPALIQQLSGGSGRRRESTSSYRDILRSSVDGTHLSPATPFIEESDKEQRPTRKITILQTILFNACAIALVCAAGILGWYVSPGSKHEKQPTSGDSATLHFDPLGQIFGYLCAVFYLGSRVPQILLNFRRKSTDGVSLLFFLFACIGNLTYVLSILAYSPVCGKRRCRPDEAAALYERYMLVNLSWLLGSFGTLLLDMGIFAQFFWYKDNAGSETDTPEEPGA